MTPVLEYIDVPERSLAQRMDALARANRVRIYRADMKRELARGRVSVVDLLTDVAPEMESMKVFELLLAVPKVGRVKANRILAREMVSPSKTIAGLSRRQRAALLVALAPYARR